LAELRTVNPLVVGSNPTLGAMTKYKYDMSHLLRKEIQILYLANQNSKVNLGDIGLISAIHSSGTISVEINNLTIDLIPTIDKWKLL